MDKKYIELFTQIAKTTAILSNQVAEYDHKNNNEKGAQDAISMKNDFQALADKLSADDFDTNSLTLSDFRKILVEGLYQGGLYSEEYGNFLQTNDIIT